VIREEPHEACFLFSFSLWVLFLESELELLVTVEIGGPSLSKVLLDYLSEEFSIGGSLLVGGCPGSCFSQKDIHYTEDVLVSMKRVVLVDEEIHLQVGSRPWGGDARVDFGPVDLAVHLVHRLLPVPVFNLRFRDVSHRRVEAGLLEQLVAVHEPRAEGIEQAAEGGLLQKIEVWMWLDRDPCLPKGGLEIPKRGCRFEYIVVVVFPE